MIETTTFVKTNLTTIITVASVLFVIGAIYLGIAFAFADDDYMRAHIVGK